MNISTAEFDWISLILVIGAGLIGWIKSNNAKKTQVPPVFEQPGQIGEEEEILPNVEEYTITENKKEHKNYIIFTKIFIESPCLSHVRVLK